MAQRIVTITSYLFSRLLFSLAGVFYILLALVFWRIFFDPRQSTPELSYYMLVTALFGAGITFLVTLSVAGRAYRATNYPLLARLPSRVEHLTAVLGASLLLSFLLQSLVAGLATYRGPSLLAARALEIPPIWLAVDILAAALALHASDLVTAGWSRVYLYTLLAIFLFGQGLEGGAASWLAARLAGAARWLMGQNLIVFGDLVDTLASWLSGAGSAVLDRLFSLPFWPVHAIADAVQNGGFAPVQALAPAILLLYATILFMLAADLFANKDLFLTE
ncbi:MAG: hypothetical protein RRC07_14975 [Anaerolineae bacterium]|nr:hypothetical protein [Anaerolineae bacterium]